MEIIERHLVREMDSEELLAHFNTLKDDYTNNYSLLKEVKKCFKQITGFTLTYINGKTMIL